MSQGIRQMRIAVIGGAFNPVHNEHVNIVKAAVRELALDKVLIMPTACSPHKSGNLTASGEQRFEMCKLAFAEVIQAEVCPYELQKGGISYSFETCEYLAEKYPFDSLFFIIGADMLASFAQWKNPERILRCVTLAACAREDAAAYENYKSETEKKFGVKVEKFGYVGKKVSSTRIRTLAALGEDFSEYVNLKVCQYIKDNGVYALKNLWGAKALLKPDRWRHSVRVAVMCAENARLADLSEEQAITMAALHDVAKNLPSDSLYLEGFECAEDVPPPVVHQFSGAYVAEKYFNLTDKTLLDAIKYHTSGTEGMTKAQALLYLCDMLEEGRSFPGVDELRREFGKGLYRGLYCALERQVEYLNSTGQPVYGETRRAYEYLKKQLQNQNI